MEKKKEENLGGCEQRFRFVEFVYHRSRKHQLPLYKAASAGRCVVQVNPPNTSKRCSGCGKVVEKELRVRVHDCSGCGLIIDRDHNAAINILRLGLQSLGVPAGTDHRSRVLKGRGAVTYTPSSRSQGEWTEAVIEQINEQRAKHWFPNV